MKEGHSRSTFTITIWEFLLRQRDSSESSVFSVPLIPCHSITANMPLHARHTTPRWHTRTRCSVRKFIGSSPDKIFEARKHGTGGCSWAEVVKSRLSRAQMMNVLLLLHLNIVPVISTSRSSAHRSINKNCLPFLKGMREHYVGSIASMCPFFTPSFNLFHGCFCLYHGCIKARTCFLGLHIDYVFMCPHLQRSLLSALPAFS